MAAKGSGFKWAVLAVLVAGTAMLNYSNMVFASRPVDVMAQYGMDQAQLTAISSIGVLPGAFFSIALGNYFDKHGSRSIRFVGAALIALAACCQLARVYADSYVALFAITFLSGTFFLPTQVLPAKLIEAWFPRRQMGTAMGVFGASAGVGIMAVFAFGSLFATTTAALLSCAVGFGCVAALWAAFAKLPEQPLGRAGAVAGDAPKVSLKAVLTSKSMWLVMVCAAFAAGAPLFLNSYMVNAFLAKGMPAAEASMLAVVFNLSLVLGAVFAGAVASRTGRYNLPYLVLCVSGGALFLVAYLVPVGPQTFALLALAGFLGAASLALNLARIGLLPLTGEFGPENIGIAGGMNNTAMGIGMFAIPTVAAAILGNDYLGVFMTLLGFFVVMGVVGGLVVPELGEKGKLAQQALAEAEQAPASDAAGCA